MKLFKKMVVFVRVRCPFITGSQLQRALAGGGSLLVFLLAPSLRAQVASSSLPVGEGEVELPDLMNDDFSLVDLMEMEIEVTTATRMLATSLEEAPSLVTVITREQIERYGYRTVPEAVSSAPGIFMVDDLVTSNVAVRGIYAGAGSWSRTFKFMIDGKSVQDNGTGGALFGAEFVPMDSVARIEIVRGPASALYGANAFLGVINVITRVPEEEVGAEVSLEGGLIRENLGGSGSATLWAETGEAQRLWTFLSVAAGSWDRSGLEVPASSPSDAYDGQASVGDLSRPVSFLGRAGWDFEVGAELEIQTVYQRLDARQMFGPTGTLDPDNRVGRFNWVNRVDYRIPIYRRSGEGPSWDQSLDFHSWIGVSFAETLKSEHFAGPVASVHRETKNTTGEGGLELSYVLGPGSVLVGLDYLDLWDAGDSLFDESIDGAVRVRRNTPNELNIQNVGVFSQLMFSPWQSLTLTGSLRHDVNSRFDDATSFRIASVLKVANSVHLKAMIGSAFVPPSPSQLNAVPLFLEGGFLGNPDVVRQKALTYEAALLTRPFRTLKIDLSAFVTNIKDRVENIPIGSLFRAENQTQSNSFGGELNGGATLGDFILQADIAYQRTTLEEPEQDSFRWQLAYGEDASTANFPTWLSHQKATWSQPRLYFEVSVMGTYVGARKSTVDNIVVAGEPYYLDPYFLLGGQLRSLGVELIPLRETRFSFHANNILGANYSHGGAAGVDIPALGRSIFFRVSQEF